MAASFASYVDVEARWRTLTSAEQDIADQLAQDASDMIRDRWPTVDARIAAGTLSADSVIRIVANMVKRAMISPAADGVTEISETQGPFSHGEKYANPLGSLFFTAADILFFDGPAARRAFAVDLAQPPSCYDWSL